MSNPASLYAGITTLTAGVTLARLTQRIVQGVAQRGSGVATSCTLEPKHPGRLPIAAPRPRLPATCHPDGCPPLLAPPHRSPAMTTPRRWIAAILALGAVVALVFAFTGDPSPSGAAPAAAGATAVLVGARVCRSRSSTGSPDNGSPRSSPPTSPTPAAATWSKSGGAVLAADQVDTPLIPASGQKLFVAAAALDDAGPRLHVRDEGRGASRCRQRRGRSAVPRRRVEIRCSPPTTTSNWIAGQSRLKTTVFTHLEALADAIVNSGVHRIPGGVVADDSRYDAQRQVAGWSPSYLSDGDIGPHRRAHRERRLSLVHAAPADRRPGRARRHQAHGPARRPWRAGRRADSRRRAERRQADRQGRVAAACTTSSNRCCT